MGLLFRLGFLFCWVGLGFSQIVHRDFWDGLLYVRVREGMESQMPVYRAGETPIPESLRELILNYNIQTIQPAFRLKHPRLDNYYEITFLNIWEVEELMESLYSLPYVEFVERKAIDRLLYVPNDYNLIFQPLHLDRIRAPQAWDLARGDSNIVLAVVDAAILTSHPDLAPNLWHNWDEIPNNGIDDDNNGYVDDTSGWDMADNDNDPRPNSSVQDHGTLVSGVANAATDNGIGVASIAFNVKLLPIKAANFSGLLIGTYSGVEYAIQNGAHVINCSWGNYYYEQTFQDLVDVAYEKGIMIVAGAGNDDTNTVMYPAGYNHVIAVGATNVTDDQKASYSNYGPQIDVMAPSGMLSTSDRNGGSYGYCGGTSCASPLVAGLIALMRSARPDLSPDQIEQCLKDGCINIDSLNPGYEGQLGAGRIDAYNALRCVTDEAHYACASTLYDKRFQGTPTLVQFGNDFPAGHNSSNESAKAERISGFVGYDHVARIDAYFGKAAWKDSNSTIQFSIWAYDSVTKGPGNLIYTKSYPIYQISEAIAQQRSVQVWLDSLVPISHPFFVGIELTYQPGDTVALLTNSVSDPQQPDQTWVRYSFGVWDRMENAWGKPYNLMIFPLLAGKNAVIPKEFSIVQDTMNPYLYHFSVSLLGSYDSLVWDIGATTVSNQLAFSYQYQNEGIYPITLSIYKDTCITQLNGVVSTPLSLFSNQVLPDFSVFPNPIRRGEKLWCKIPNLRGQSVQWRLYNERGQVVYKGKGQAGKDGIQIVFPQEIGVGHYVMLWYNDEGFLLGRSKIAVW